MKKKLLHFLYVGEFKEVLMEVVDLDDSDDHKEGGSHQLNEEVAGAVHLQKQHCIVRVEKP